MESNYNNGAMSILSSVVSAITGDQVLFGNWFIKCPHCGQIDDVHNGTKHHECTKCHKETKINGGFYIMCANPDCKQADHVSDFTKKNYCSVCGSRKGKIRSISLQIPFSELTMGPVIGEGSYGRVVKAEWHGEEYAVKQFKYRNLDSKAKKEMRASVINETNMLSTLAHESIVCLKGVTTDPSSGDKTPYLVMEYMRDGSLDALIGQGAQLPKAVIIQILLDVADGLIYLHSHSVIHRDIKSGNILLYNNKTRAKVSDFGTARIYDQISGNKPTSGVGTIGFMAPEVLEGKNYDERADVYSFGVLAYHMLTATVLGVMFNEKDHFEKIETTITDEAFRTLIVGCCRADPSQRLSIIRCAAFLRTMTH